jgi:hypothetical protein
MSCRQAHKTFYPHCRFVLGKEDTNIPLLEVPDILFLGASKTMASAGGGTKLYRLRGGRRGRRAGQETTERQIEEVLEKQRRPLPPQPPQTDSRHSSRFTPQMGTHRWCMVYD